MIFYVFKFRGVKNTIVNFHQIFCFEMRMSFTFLKSRNLKILLMAIISAVIMIKSSNHNKFMHFITAMQSAASVTVV